VIGLASFPERTLVDRAMALMLEGPCGADRLAREVMGLRQAPLAVAERLSVAMFAADPRVRQLEDGRWALVAEAQGSPLLEDCAFAVVDVETTGMRATGPDRVTDVAVVVLQGARRELVFESLVNPRAPIPPRIAALTGITAELVANAPEFEAIADQLLAALAGRVFVAHNARFDWGFLTAEVRRARALGLTGTRLCTVRLARRLLPQLESRSLDSLSYFFGLENRARHRAAGDALATAEVLERLLLIAREQGARTLADLEALHKKKVVPRSAFRVPRRGRSAHLRDGRQDFGKENAERGTRNVERWH
jgi:DNA polymerase-3 subunit epsilon